MATALKPTNTTAVARTDEAPSPVAVLLQEHRSRLEDLLPEGMRFSRLIAIVRTEVAKNPKILECSPVSIIESIARIQQWGLEIGVDAYLVPFKGVCTPISDYKGLAKLMVNSRAVRAVQARAVFANEKFRYNYGLQEELEHHPIHDPKERGAIIGAYCILRLPGGNDVFEFMSLEDIEAIRQRYSKQWKDGPCPPWYAKKTVIRQVSKLVPKSPKFVSVLAVMEDEDKITEGADWTVDDDEPAVVESTPATPTAAAAPAADATQVAASPEQVKRIMTLLEHTALDETPLAAKTRARVNTGVTAAFADRIIVGLEAEIKKVTPAPVPEPTVAQLQAAADSASIHELSLKYKELIESDRVAPNTQNAVRERMAKIELTVDVLRAAIAELEDAEIPF